MKTSTFVIIILVLGVALTVFYFYSIKETPTTMPISVTQTSYSASIVANHATASDCWSIVNGNVYNLTNWISRHPGGTDKILSMCGIDASLAYDTQHNTQARPLSELINFKIGILAN